MAVEFVLTGATILRGPDLTASEESWIKVGEDGRISALGNTQSENSNVLHFDASGMIICPAFLNAHTHVIDGFLKETGFGLPYWDVFMPPDGLRHQALSLTPDEVVKEQLGQTLDQMIACGTSLFVDFREGGRPGVKLLEEVAADRPIQPLTLGRFASYPPQSATALASNRGVLTEDALAEVSGIVEEGAGFSLQMKPDRQRMQVPEDFQGDLSRCVLRDPGKDRIPDLVESQRRKAGQTVGEQCSQGDSEHQALGGAEIREVVDQPAENQRYIEIGQLG